MADGRHKKIAEIKVGEEVMTIDPQSLKITTAHVINQYVKSTTKPIVQVTTLSGRQLAVRKIIRS